MATYNPNDGKLDTPVTFLVDNEDNNYDLRIGGRIITEDGSYLADINNVRLVLTGSPPGRDDTIDTIITWNANDGV